MQPVLDALFHQLYFSEDLYSDVILISLVVFFFSLERRTFYLNSSVHSVGYDMFPPSPERAFFSTNQYYTYTIFRILIFFPFLEKCQQDKEVHKIF